jgi:hypothetical protein
MAKLWTKTALATVYWVDELQTGPTLFAKGVMERLNDAKTAKTHRWKNEVAEMLFQFR